MKEIYLKWLNLGLSFNFYAKRGKTYLEKKLLKVTINAVGEIISVCDNSLGQLRNIVKAEYAL